MLPKVSLIPCRQGIPDAPGMDDVLRRIGLPEEVATEFAHVKLPFELRPNQYHSLQGILAWSRMGLFDETRVGKSICMQLAMVYLAHYGYKCIAVMPPILFDQFAMTLAEIGGHNLRGIVFNHTPAKRKHILNAVADGGSDLNLLVMTREIFKAELENLMLAGFNSLTFDECHQGLQTAKLKTQKGQRTTYGSVKWFVENTQDSRLVLATGTPVLTSLIGTYPIISLKTPSAYRNESEFQNTHVNFIQRLIKTPRGSRTILVPSEQYSEVELLTRNLHAQAVRARKLEVLSLDVPNVQEVPIHLNPKHMAIYKQIVTERVLEVGTDMIDARSSGQLRSLAMQVISDPSIAAHPAPDNTIHEAVRTLLDIINVRHNKVVLFAEYNRSVEALAKAFKQHDPAVVYGPNGPDKNRAHANRFLTADSCRLLIANPAAGGVGLTLGGVCTTVIFVEPVGSPGLFDQAASRVILAGQKEPVTIYIFRVLGTISPKATDTMLGRMVASKEVSRDKKSLLDELLGQSE